MVLSPNPDFILVMKASLGGALAIGPTFSSLEASLVGRTLLWSHLKE